jgi:hypothetical protein
VLINAAYGLGESVVQGSICSCISLERWLLIGNAWYGRSRES